MQSEQLTKKFICIDCSGSTGNHSKYWDHVKDVLEKNYDDNSSIVFWDTEVKSVTKQDALKHIEKKTGCGGTAPVCLSNILTEKSNVILITDGQISPYDVSKCDSMLKDREFESVSMHFYSTGGDMNMSVAAPFTRNTKYIMYTDGILFSSGSTKELIDLSKYENDPQSFIDDFEQLLKQVTVITMGKPNIQLRNMILDMKDKLMSYIVNNKSKELSDPMNKLRNILQSGNYESGLATIKKIITNVGSTDIAKEINRITNILIDRCANSRNFDFNLLDPSKLMRADVVEDVKEELPEVKEYSGLFECPIIMDIDMPCCLIADGEPIFKSNDMENSYLNDIMANPLLTLADPNLVTKLKSRLDHVLGLSSVRMLYENKNMKSPFTRNNIVGVLSFGTDKTHMKSVKYALSKLFFGNKLVGTHELWLAVVYMVSKDISYLRENTEYMDAFKSYLLNRLKTRETHITLTGLPIEPIIRCPIDIALWYCVVSPKIANPNSCQNRLRDQYKSGRFMTELVDMLDYPYDKEFTTKSLAIYNVFNWMMEQENNNNREWRKVIRSIYQNSTKLSDGTIIMLDGISIQKYDPVSSSVAASMSMSVYADELLKYWNVLTDEEIYSLSTKVDRMKKKELINLSYDMNMKLPAAVENYTYKNTSYVRRIQICPATMRPYSLDKHINVEWNVSAESLYGKLTEILSVNQYFINFVTEKLKYPSDDEYIKYMSQKQENKGLLPRDTLPSVIRQFVGEIFREYKIVLGDSFEKVTPENFVLLTKNSMDKTQRLIMENLYDASLEC